MVLKQGSLFISMNRVWWSANIALIIMPLLAVDRTRLWLSLSLKVNAPAL